MQAVYFNRDKASYLKYILLYTFDLYLASGSNSIPWYISGNKPLQIK